MKIELAGLTRLVNLVHATAQPDARPLMFTWQRIIEEDNRKGVLAGTDRYGRAMEHVRYRPVKAKKGLGAKLTDSQRNGLSARKKRGVFSGLGPSAAGLHNNLTPQEYRKLAGPPLAPRGAFSRVITNLVTRFEPDSPDARMAYGEWKDVVSTKGVKFLPYHFNGEGRLPVRDLRGVRPEGVEKARKSAIAWLLDIIRTHARAA